MKKTIKFLLCILVYPIGMAVGIFQSLRRWFSNFDVSEVSSAHRDWKRLTKEVMHPGFLAWEERKRTAARFNEPFNEPAP